MKKSIHSVIIIVIGLLFISSSLFVFNVPTTINDFFLPGSQPGQSGNLETPNKCDNCHGGYDKAVEPAFNWRGSMMAQAMRDPLYFASVAIANQDAPDSGDLCIRCHAPDGWLNGRSIPTDGSALNNNDFQGVQCDFCHKLVKPSSLGVNPFEGDLDYLRETYESDQEYLGKLTIIPPQSGNGMYVAHDANAKRGPFVDAQAKHKMNYSPFHSESDLCATCHDVSNPAFVKTTENADGTFNYEPNLFDTPSESFETYMMFPVERTYSEWKMSAFNSADGVSGTGLGGNKENVSSCQDCHMRDVSGYGANKRNIPFRHNLPLHDMTGGNTFVPLLVAQLYPDEVDQEALLEGIERAKFMLENAAIMEVIPDEVEGGYNGATVKITNNTGHKLPSGYPEGRRIWINIIAYDSNDNIVFESGHYDYEMAELTKENTKIYEAKLAMTEAVEKASGRSNDLIDGSSFHFVLNNKVIKDNRIPPRGFKNAMFIEIQSPPVGYSYSDGQYWDETAYNFNAVASKIVVKLFYQTTSKEYVTFLKEANFTTNDGEILYNLWANNGKSEPVVMEEISLGGSVSPPTGDVQLLVNDIQFSRVVSTRKGGKTQLTAIVSVEDENQNPVEGATVNGQFSGPTNSPVQGVTNEQGIVVFTTSTKKASSEWCLGISSVVKEGYQFSTNVQFCEQDQLSKIEQSNSNVTVFPNPANDVVRLKLDGIINEAIKIEVFNYSGVLMKTLNIIHSGGINENISLPVNELKPGIYFIRINHNQKTATRIVRIN